MPFEFPYFSDTTKPTDLLESWPQNATERMLSASGQPSMPDGQWLRKINLTVYGAGGASGGLDLSNMRINFTVKKFTNASPNMLEARVYNLSKPPGPNTEGQVKQYHRVQLAAGYQFDNFGMIFDGEVILYIQGKENPTDSYIDIHASDQDKAIQTSSVSLQWPKGTTWEQRARDKLGQAGVPIGQIKINGDQPSLRSVSYVGMLSRGMRIITNATQSDFWIDNGQAYVIPWDSYLDNEIVELSPQTGLVGIPKVTPAGIEAQCLLNPKLKVGGLVHIKSTLLSGVPYLPGTGDDSPWAGFKPPNAPAQFEFSAAMTSPTGIYKILLLDHLGDTRGNPWYSQIVGVAAGADGKELPSSNLGTAYQRSGIGLQQLGQGGGGQGGG